MTTRAAPTQRGFTLTEMMVVVAMIAVLAGLAVANFDSAPRASDAASTMAALVRETARKAVEGGAVRDDVVAGFGTARTKLVITNDDGRIVFSIEKLVEDPNNADAAWVVLGTRTMAKGLEASGYSDQADLTDGNTPEVTLGTAEILCYPDGICDGATVFFSGRRTDRARVAVLPLGGAPVTYRTW
jgi:prepilin-type N-terminal cleavage/methylation domain-containing protein